MRQTSILTAGIDTSKAKLDIAIDGKQRWQVANASKGWHELVAVLKDAGVTRIGIEATGGYERGVVRHLRAEGFVVLVLQPMQVRAVAQLRLRRAKNDAIDATLIAACATMMEPHELEPDARLAELSDRLTMSSNWRRTSRAGRRGTSIRLGRCAQMSRLGSKLSKKRPLSSSS